MEQLTKKEKPKILLIDDSGVDRELSSMMLTENGFNVTALESANNCLQAITDEMPDLILLDIMMPETDGNQALRMMRKHYNRIELPIIMATSKADASDVIESLKAGANDYITKPIRFEIAIRRIKTHLTISAQSRQMAQAKELAAIHTMITTYNHEINNPLTIALGTLDTIKENNPHPEELQKLHDMLWRIADIVKKTCQVIEKGSLEYKKYTESSKLLDLQK